MIFPQIKARIQPGRLLGSSYTVTSYETNRDGEEVLVYRIRKRAPSTGRPSQKRITKSEWEQAHARLLAVGEFSREWFRKNMPNANASPCNFTVIGEAFLLLGVADSHRPAKYIRAQQAKAAKK